MIDHAKGVIAAQSGIPAEDPNQILDRFRALQHEIAYEIDSYTTSDDTVENSHDCADHNDRLAELYREASDFMAAMDDHLSAGGQPPAAWTDTRTAHPR